MDVVQREERTEWMVETEQTEDDFGTDEAGAREWLTRVEDNPEWLPALLRRRTVVVETSDWETVS